ncbi:MAG: preprotein translocase subunit YajC [Microbacteriaceae bacterium]
MDSIFLIVMIAFMAVLMWNSSRTRKKQAAELASRLEVGAEVMLGSGIYGTVEAVADDRIVIKSSTATLEVARAAVARVTKSAADNAATPKASAPAKKAPAKKAAAATKKPAAKQAK